MGENLGKILVVVGLTLASLGVIVMLGGRFPWLRLGRLPGDIAYERDGFGFYMPITTMILISALATLIFWIVGMVRR